MSMLASSATIVKPVYIVTTFTQVVDKILTNYIVIENTLLLNILNQYPKVNQKSEYRKLAQFQFDQLAN